MMKEVARSLDPGLLPILGLLAFIAAFTLILIRVMTMKKAERETAKNLPMDDPEPVVFPTNHHPTEHHA